MGASVSVKVIKDTKGAGVAALQRRLRAGIHRVLVGVPAGPTTPDGTSLAEVAAWTEFGTSTAPERPFLRGGVREALPLCRQLAVNDLRAVAEGRMTIPMALERQGFAAEGSVKKYMAGDNFAPNAPSTIAKKGSEQPTIDSGQLRQAVTHIVEGGQ
jgi:hypothetical protein